MTAKPVPNHDYLVNSYDGMASVETCDHCYALVPFYDFEKHAEWHQRLADVLQRTEAVNQ